MQRRHEKRMEERLRVLKIAKVLVQEKAMEEVSTFLHT
jgi:hypothetical protein